MNYFRIPPSRAPAVVSCGAIFLVRSQRGVAYASHSVEIPFKRRGQAVRDAKLPSNDDLVKLNFLTLDIFDTDSIADQLMLLQTISAWVNRKPIPVPFDEPSQKNLITLHGRQVTKAYLELLPHSLRKQFLDFKIFAHHPDWKR
jgi:hypothetical protein